MIARAQELLLSIIASNPLLERLAAASIDLVVVTALVAAVVTVARIRSRRVIAFLWMVALIKPVLSLALGTPAPLIPITTPSAPDPATAVTRHAPVVEEAREVVVTDEAGRVVAVAQERTTVPAAAATAGMPATTGGGVEPDTGVAGDRVATLWLLGVVAMLGYGAVARVRLRRVIRASVPAGADVAKRCDRLAARVARGRARRRPPVRVTTALESPALAGTLHPVILLPEWMVAPEHSERLEWALRHELAHWHACDHLTAAAAEFARALFFFHPAAWWTARRWKEAMEMACDQSVVTSRGEVRRYAEQLYQILAHVDERRRMTLSPSLFATRTQIGRRIETLLRTQPRVARPGAAGVAATAVFALATFAFGADFAPRPPKAPEAPPVPAVAEVDMDATPGNAHYDNVNVFEINDHREVRLHAEGIAFERGSGRVIALDDDGFLRVRETAGGTERRVLVTPDPDGGLKYSYRVDGERADFDDDARRWLSQVLRDHLTRVRNRAPLPPRAPEPPLPGRASTPLPPAAPEPVIAPSPQPAPDPAPAPEPPPAPERERRG